MSSTPCCTPASGKAAAKPLIAKRFKTTPCKTFEETGRCPYVTRCMFAHGRRDLRTAEQNIADGLISEEAVKEWKAKRAEHVAIKVQRCNATPKAPAVAVEQVQEAATARKGTTSPAPIAIEGESTPSSRAATPVSSTSVCDAADSNSAPATPSMQFITVPPRHRGWRHDPYATFSGPVSPLVAAFGRVGRA